MTCCRRDRHAHALLVLAWCLGQVFAAVFNVMSVQASDELELEVSWLNAKGVRIDPSSDALGLSRESGPLAGIEGDPARFKLRIASVPKRPSIRLSLVSLKPGTGSVRDRIEIRLPVALEGAVETPWIVLVFDEEERFSPRREGRALRAGIEDTIEARVRIGGARAASWVMPVSRPSDEDHTKARMKIRLNVAMLREDVGGSPVAGSNSAEGRAIITYQLEVVSEILSQCAIDIGRIDLIPVRVVDPPGPGMISIGNRFGFPSAGGKVRLSVDGVRLGPWTIGHGYTPDETGRLIGHQLETAGFKIRRSRNAGLDTNAFQAADILVYREDNSLATVTKWPDQPLTTDPRQALEIGALRLDDGLDTYNDNNAHVGTIEERILIKALADNDIDTIDVFVISRFTRATRQGESFVHSENTYLGNTVIIDTQALGRARQSYTLSHELGHVLAGSLDHPDSSGDSRPQLLMHSRSSSALAGPKQLTASECEHIRKRIKGKNTGAARTLNP
jgi:hypothetical protein